MVNRYPAPCAECGGTVPANGGTVTKEGRRWAVRHLACAEAKGPAVVSFYSPTSGKSWTRNARGTCIDAPCCGCCN